MISPFKPGARPPKEPLISPEADRELFKQLIAYGGIFIVLFVLAPPFAAWVNLPACPVYKFHRILDWISTLIIMVPFFLGVNATNNTRMKYARKYVQEERWTAVYYSVESFTHLGQNWMDSTGEAHYLLAIALERQGKKDEARKARDFVVKHRPSGPWALKLREVEASRAPRKISEIVAERGDSGKKLNKARRRF